MSDARYHGRKSVSIENSHLRVTVLREGGHIAEILDKQTGVNPLWMPPWQSIEPSAYDPAVHNFGPGPDARLLAGIMGHSLCLDLFGGPSAEEAGAGITAHGEASIALYSIEQSDTRMTLHASLPLAQLHFERVIELQGRAVRIHEAVDNLSATDRPIAWTQHVSLGPPFLEKGATQFRMSATRSKVFETEFGSAGYLRVGAEFDWPMAPKSSQDYADLRVVNDSPASRHTPRILWTRSGTMPSFLPLRRNTGWPSDTSGDAATSHGWAFGKRIVAAITRLGTAGLSREGWNSAFPRCRSRGVK
jgi:hypothetical protein